MMQPNARPFWIHDCTSNFQSDCLHTWSALVMNQPPWKVEMPSLKEEMQVLNEISLGFAAGLVLFPLICLNSCRDTIACDTEKMEIYTSLVVRLKREELQREQKIVAEGEQGNLRRIFKKIHQYSHSHPYYNGCKFYRR